MLVGCAGDAPRPRAARDTARAVRATVVPSSVDERADTTPDSERGCTLTLDLTDQATDERVSTECKLYRLDVPADAEWTRGDLLERTVDHGPRPCRVRGLPDGRYRLRIDAQRCGSEDPPPFTVSGAETRVSFSIPMPREFHGRLIVVDEQGAPIRSGRSRFGSHEFSGDMQATPWLSLRQPLVGERVSEELQGWHGHGDADFNWTAVHADARGFELWPWREMARGERRYTCTDWSFEARTPVELAQDFQQGRDVTYLALSVDPKPIRDAIRLPDGGSAAAAGARIEIQCDAVLLAARPDPERWRSLKLSVSVSLEGYPPQNFGTTVANSTERRTLSRDLGVQRRRPWRLGR
jgi:hypothetical protein